MLVTQPCHWLDDIMTKRDGPWPPAMMWLAHLVAIPGGKLTMELVTENGSLVIMVSNSPKNKA